MAGRQIIKTKGFGCFPHGRFRLHRTDHCHQGHLIAAVGLANIFKYPVPAAAAEIQINIWRIDSGWIYEPLEQKIVGDGIDGGDACAIGDQRISDAASCTDWYIISPGILTISATIRNKEAYPLREIEVNSYFSRSDTGGGG